MTMFATLDAENNVVPLDDVRTWASEFEKANRRVGKTVMRGLLGAKITVSTVFLGVNHGWGAGAAPLWFETMVFIDGRNDKECVRYTTYDEARAGHEAMVRKWYWKQVYHPLTDAWEAITWWSQRQLWSAKRGWTALRTKLFSSGGDSAPSETPSSKTPKPPTT